MVEAKSEIIPAGLDTSMMPSKDWTKEYKLVKEITAKGCNDTEFKLLWHLSKIYDLNPLKKEIWAVKGFGEAPAQIFVSRDGLLSIAHRSGQFGNMETSCELDPKTQQPVSATCTIYRRDYDKPFKVIVFFDEYNQKQALWLKKPKAMLMKVAEATCLRRAFNVSGVYSPEEFPEAKEVRQDGKDIDKGKPC
jgi:phage recombination protein Bet